MTRENLKRFRHDIAVLKKKGLVENVDARSVQPTPRLKKLVDRFDDVLSGKATPVKVSPKETQALKDAGYETYKGKVIYPHAATEKVTVSGGHVKLRQPNGVERITLPIKEEKLEKFFNEIVKKERAIDKMKRSDAYFAFRFYGNDSRYVYKNIGNLVDDLRNYKSVKAAKKSKDAEMMQDIYRNIEIVKVNRKRNWFDAPKPERKPLESASTPARRLSENSRLATNASKLSDYRKRDAARKKAKRAKMSESEKSAQRKKNADAAQRRRDERTSKH